MGNRLLDQRVYFIQSGHNGPIKIGISDNPKARRAHMQTASHEPLRLLGDLPGGAEREKQLHAYLSAHRIRGEWFSPHPVVLAVTPGDCALDALQELLGVDRMKAAGFKLKHVIESRLYTPAAALTRLVGEVV